MLLWSHYGNQHYGVVVGFDGNHKWFHQKATPQDELRHLVRVSYLQNAHPRTISQLNGVDLLYTKSSEWSYEREWRIIRALKDGTEVSPGKHCFDVPTDMIHLIIFGCRTDPAFEAEIRLLVSSNPSLSHVRYKRATLSSTGSIELLDA
jgi:hypothetical protein